MEDGQGDEGYQVSVDLAEMTRRSLTPRHPLEQEVAQLAKLGQESTKR